MPNKDETKKIICNVRYSFQEDILYLYIKHIYLQHSNFFHFKLKNAFHSILKLNNVYRIKNQLKKIDLTGIQINFCNKFEFVKKSTREA